MTKQTTKSALLQKVAELQEVAQGLKPSRTLKVNLQRDASPSVLYSRGAHDMNIMDDMRRHMKQEMVHRLADELIRSGAVRFEETLLNDGAFFGPTIRVTARVEVC